MIKSLRFWLTMFAVSYLVQETLCRRMSLRAKRKKVLRQMLEKEARRRNDTLMMRLLHDDNSQNDPNDPNRPPYPKEYEDISHYTLPPHMRPGPNESAIDNSDFVREMVEDFPSKKTPRTTTPKRNRTTSKYKKKLAERSSTTLSPEVIERLQNLTTFSFLHLTPVSIEEDTVFPFPHEKLDPKYYTYRSKAWTTTNFTNSSRTGVRNSTSGELCGRLNGTTASDNSLDEKVSKTIVDYNDFDNPATKGVENIDETMDKFTSNFTKLLSIVRQYERLVRVSDDSGDGDVDKTNKNHGSRVRNLIKNDFDIANNDETGINKLLLKIDSVDAMTDEDNKGDNNLDEANIEINNSVTVDDNVQDKSGKDKNVQYNDYNEKDDEVDFDKRNDRSVLSDKEENTIVIHEKEDGNGEHERNVLIEDILSKYCRENVAVFESNLEKDSYYNTLKSVLELFVKEMGSQNIMRTKHVESTKDKLEENGKIYSDSIDEKKDGSEHKCKGNRNENSKSEIDELEKACDDLDSQELSTMKPLIHRVNEVYVDTKGINTVKMNIVTNFHEKVIESIEKDEYSQKNVADIMNEIDTNATDGLKNLTLENEDTLKNEIRENEFEDSSKNDKVIAEMLLNNKLKEEIKKINILIDKVNLLNGSVGYDHIRIENNASFHEIVEKLRTKRTVQLQKRQKRSESNPKIAYVNELMKYLEDYETFKKRQKREEHVETTEPEPQDPRLHTYDPFKEIRKPRRYRRSKSEENYDEKETARKGQIKKRQKREEHVETTEPEPQDPRLHTYDPFKEIRKPRRYRRSKSEENYDEKETARKGQIKKRQKREEHVETTEPEPQDPRLHTYDPFKEIRKPRRYRRSKSEENYDEKETARKGQKVRNKPQIKPLRDLTSKEKYYYPKLTTHDPGGELWREVKRDYETDPKIRKIIDTSQVAKEEFNSRMWNCKGKSPEVRKKRDTISEEEYYEKEYQRKMKADHKKRVLDDESPETTEATTPDLKFLDISRSRARRPIDVDELGMSRPEEFMKALQKRDLTNMNRDDVFQRYDPDESNFVENLAKHARRSRRHAQNRHNRRHKRFFNDGLLKKLIPNFGNQPERTFGNQLRQALRRRRRAVERQHHLSQENVDKLDYDMYHGLKYGVTEVFEGDLDLTGMYTRYTAATVGRYQRKRYEEFRKFYMDASSTFKDPFIKVSLAVCPFCGDYFGNREKLLFHENYNHFNIFSTVVPVTLEPTATVSGAVKDKDINDIFEMILKDPDLATASEKWGEFIDQHINPTKRMEYRNLLFNESVTAFKTVPVHIEEETTVEPDPNVKVIAYPSDYHRKENYSYPRDVAFCANKSIPLVNLYENPEAFLKKLMNHEPILPGEQYG